MQSLVFPDCFDQTLSKKKPLVKEGLSKLKNGKSNICFEDMEIAPFKTKTVGFTFMSFQNCNFIANPKQSEGLYLFSSPFHAPLHGKQHFSYFHIKLQVKRENPSSIRSQLMN